MIIGFAGKAASGKTTAARHLVGLLDTKTHIIPMASLLREEVEDFLRRSGGEEFVPLVYGSQEDKVRIFYIDEAKALKSCPFWADFLQRNRSLQDRPGQSALTVRLILQWWGTEYRRAQDPDYWTKAWETRVRGYDLDRVHILVDDVRFANELEMLRRFKARIVKIERPGFNGAGNHASETSLDGYEGWDAVLVNDGTLEQFFRKVENLARQWRLLPGAKETV